MSYRTYISASRTAYIAGIEAGISPQELRAHTGVIGEAFVADYLDVKLSSANNQPGYDLVDSDGLRVSVKTITTSTGVGVNERTIDQVDRVVVVWLNTVEDELEVVVVYDRSIEEFLSDAAESYRGKLRLGRGAMAFPLKVVAADKFEVGKIIDSHQSGNIVIRRHASGSFTALVDGVPQPARQYLLDMRDAMGLPEKATNTTRSLGAQVFGSRGNLGNGLTAPVADAELDLNAVRTLVLADDVSLDKPGIYTWTIEGVGRYVGRYTNASRPLTEYSKNIRNLLAGRSYRKSNPDGFRKIHRELANAVQNGVAIELRIEDNCDQSELNQKEREAIKRLAWGGLNATKKTVR